MSEGWVEGDLEVATTARPVAMWVKVALLTLDIRPESGRSSPAARRSTEQERTDVSDPYTDDAEPRTNDELIAEATKDLDLLGNVMVQGANIAPDFVMRSVIAMRSRLHRHQPEAGSLACSWCRWWAAGWSRGRPGEGGIWVVTDRYGCQESRAETRTDHDARVCIGMN